MQKGYVHGIVSSTRRKKTVSTRYHLCVRKEYIHVFGNASVSLEGYMGNGRDTRCWQMGREGGLLLTKRFL